ncbi:MAG: hypothetical protein A3K19_04305 [Lentisphaerae bacterium RIFOXYB12_FULL_65_16]|nr:MAG: hypothetical protein A3K18_09395 [Lentisphaerae bacterium RIFOXYA12_64_32]OGV84305.1 MAG: hypothetical protein A3K19_04305 [Lentisphaerae bacterium RIFOXYB12_FULL_65_16]
MDQILIPLLVAALCIWGVVLIVRTLFSRRASPEEIARLVNSIMGPMPDEPGHSLKPTPDQDEILSNLLKFFEVSAASRSILQVLVKSERQLTVPEVTTVLNGLPSRLQQPPLPEHAVRAVLVNLIAANLVQLGGDTKLAPTPAGRKVMEHISPPTA